MEDNQALEGMRNSEQDCNDSYDWQEEQNEKANFKQPKLRDLFPVNYVAQKDRFFQESHNYNPHFCYNTIVSPQVRTVHSEHQVLAQKILVNNKHEGHKLPLLSQEEVLKAIEEYLEGLGLNDYVEVIFEFNCLSRTSVVFYSNRAVLKLRTPLEYNKVSLEGVLNHEVGTHILRRLNHKENCVRKPTDKGKLIEQGLASINQSLPQQQPFLFKAALRYLAAIYASKMPFSQLYKQLSKFMKDKNDCWRECVRVKRGVANTQDHGGYYKDQNYLIGAIEILRERKNIDFKKLYFGKLSFEETANLNSGVLPPFLDSEHKYKLYLKKLDAIALCNFID